MTTNVSSYRERLERIALAPTIRTHWSYNLFMVAMSLIVLWGLFAWYTQLRHGLKVTGLNDMVPWGIYMTNFVFFIGISYAGTLLSGILRITQAGWRTPVTRMAEIITVVGLIVGSVQIVFDNGRPDRLLNMIIYGRFQSAFVWDMLSITTYLTGAIIYLYVPLIPDIALMRDRLGSTAAPWKLWMYRVLAVGWIGTQEQKRRLNKAIGILAVMLIPIAVSAHTVLSWIFGMTLRPGWNSTIFGPYFVVGAVFSGIAGILIVMAVFRRVFHLEEYVTEKQFHYLAYLLLAFVGLYAYFSFAEYLTGWYKLAGEEKELLSMLFVGAQAPAFWFFMVGALVVPGLLIALPWTRTIPNIVLASVLVVVGMWVKRFLIVVPTLEVPMVPTGFGQYSPTWVEWSITAGSVAGFMLLFALIGKFFPMVSIWEVAEEEEAEEEKLQTTGSAVGAGAAHLAR